MKKVTTRPSFQGDLMIRRIDAVPAGLKTAVAERGVHILAHSETGHHHVIESRAADRFIDEANAFIAYLEVMEPTELKHLRDHDTHETLVRVMASMRFGTSANMRQKDGGVQLIERASIRGSLAVEQRPLKSWVAGSIPAPGAITEPRRPAPSRP